MNCVIHQDNINHILLYNVLRDKKSWCVFLFFCPLKNDKTLLVSRQFLTNDEKQHI